MTAPNGNGQVVFSKPDPKVRGKFSMPGINVVAAETFNPGSPFNNLVYNSRLFWNVRYLEGHPSGTGLEKWLDPDFSGTGTENASGYPATFEASSREYLDHLLIYCAEGDYGVDNPPGGYVLRWEGGGGVKPYINNSGNKTPVDDTATYRSYSDIDPSVALTIRIDGADISSLPDTGNGGGWDEYEADPFTRIVLEPSGLSGTTHYGGANFIRQDWITAHAPFKGGLRLMNFLAIRDQDKNTGWDARKRTTYRTFNKGAYDGGDAPEVNAPYGPPIEVAIDLCNATQLPGWFNIPHRYVASGAGDGTFPDQPDVSSWASAICENYNHETNGPFVVEYSNEVWNPIFTQQDYVQTISNDLSALEQANLGTSRFKNINGDSLPVNNAAVTFAGIGYFSTLAMKACTEVFDSYGIKYHRTLGLQTGSVGISVNYTMDVDVSPTVDGSSTAMDWHDSVCNTGYYGSYVLQEPNFSDGYDPTSPYDSPNPGLTGNNTKHNLTTNTILLDPLSATPGTVGSDEVDPVPTPSGTGFGEIVGRPEDTWDGTSRGLHYEIFTYKNDENENDSWAKLAAEISTRSTALGRNIEVLCYEGNHHMSWNGPSKPTAINGWADAPSGLGGWTVEEWVSSIYDGYDNSSFVRTHQDAFTEWNKHFSGGTYFWFVLLSSKDYRDGWWGFYPSLDIAQDTRGGGALADNWKRMIGVNRRRNI